MAAHIWTLVQEGGFSGRGDSCPRQADIRPPALRCLPWAGGEGHTWGCASSVPKPSAGESLKGVFFLCYIFAAGRV